MNKKLKSKIILKFGTQEDFAAAVGEKASTISYAVRERRNFPETKWKKWAAVLGCSLSEIKPDYVQP